MFSLYLISSHLSFSFNLKKPFNLTYNFCLLYSCQHIISVSPQNVYFIAELRYFFIIIIIVVIYVYTKMKTKINQQSATKIFCFPQSLCSNVWAYVVKIYNLYCLAINLFVIQNKRGKKECGYNGIIFV